MRSRAKPRQPAASTTPARPDPAAGARRFGLLESLCGTYPCKLWGAWIVLVAGLTVTALASLYLKADVESDAQREFDFTCNETRLEIEARLEASAQILRSGAALFAATETVSREQWRIFTRRLQIDQHLPGIQGIGFARLVPRAQLEPHVQAIRGEGFPDYHIRPAGDRELYAAIIYLEPFEDRNLRAFGYDMFSEPVRRAAMERARDENAAALSGRVTLVQETDQDVQAGVLMYVPVYRHGVPVETIAQRRAAIHGWVYSPYRMTDLMRGTLWHWDRGQTDRQISLQVYDGDVPAADTLLYDSAGVAGKVPASTARLIRLLPVDFAGRRWTLHFTQPGGLVALGDYDRVWFVLFGGTICTLLLSGLVLWRQQRVRFYRERAEAGQALIASEERFRGYVENAPDGVFIVDDKGRYLEVNSAACRMTGYSRQEFEHLSVNDLVTEESEEAGLTHFETLTKTGAATSDLWLKKKDGSAFCVALSAVKLSATRFIGFKRDITESKRMEGVLREQQKLASVGTLARGMAHEINNPLMGIMNYAELIKDQAAGNAAMVEYAAEIIAGGRRVAKMTQSLLGFTQQGAAVAFETATLESLVAAVLPPVAERAREMGMALSCDIPADLPPVTCRRGQLEQVITALLSNAVEAWGEHNKVPAGNKRILILAQAMKGTGVRLTVEDSGPGIPATIRERVFDPFFTTKDRTQHAGLGLWISRSCVQQHGGALTFESKTGHGARFHVDLPVEETGRDREERPGGEDEKG